MRLVLRPQNQSALPDGQSQVEMAGGVLSIGRGAENDLVLPDPERELSKRHCVLEQQSGDYVIRDISTNGTFLNYGAERLGDLPTPLNNGDVIIVGSFEFVVEINSDAAVIPSNTGHSYPLPPLDSTATSANVAKTTASINAIDDMADTGADFLDDLLGGPVDHQPSSSGPELDDALLPPAPLDPFAHHPSEGLSDGSSAPNHSPATQDHFAAPSPSSGVIPDDWADSFIQSKPKEAPGPNTIPEPATPQKTSAPQPVAPDVALRAFLHGAGAAHIDIPAAEVEQTMQRMGQVMGAVIAGMRDILMTRAAIKSEMRMDRTMINAGGNNPLKFSISAEQAIEAMIRPSVRGYIDADAAIKEALDDIKAHEVATMSGMEAALKDLLARLGPSQLSARIEAGSTLGGLLGGKKARYWEAYEKMYAQIAKETEDDFQSAFGKEFARAYEEQVKKL